MPLEGNETFNYCLIDKTAVLQTSGVHTLAADDVDSGGGIVTSAATIFIPIMF